MKRPSIFILFAGMAVLLAACSSGSSSSRLMTAMQYAPANAIYFGFVDWRLLRANLGADEISQNSSQDDIDDFFINITKREAFFSEQYYPGLFFMQYEDWGWNQLNIEWEAAAQGSGLHRIYILKFREEMDFAAFKDLLEQRGYSAETFGGTLLYTHPMDFDVFSTWDILASPDLFNIAFIENQKILIFSISPDAVKAALDTAAGKTSSLAQNPAAAAIGIRVGEVPGAYLIGGEEICQNMRPNSLSYLSPEAREELLRKYGTAIPTQEYDFLGFAYHRRDGTATGLILFHYTDSSSAAIDLPIRQNFMENGKSLITRKKYSESLFTLTSIAVEGNLLIAEIAPYNDMPSRISQMIQTRDLGFAACNP